MIEFISKKIDCTENAVHTLKCIEPFYSEIKQGGKTFEVRKDDRSFKYKEGDYLLLYRIIDEVITGEWITKEVTYVLRNAEDFGLMSGFVIMSIK